AVRLPHRLSYSPLGRHTAKRLNKPRPSGCLFRLHDLYVNAVGGEFYVEHNLFNWVKIVHQCAPSFQFLASRGPTPTGKFSFSPTRFLGSNSDSMHATTTFTSSATVSSGK